MVLNDRDNNENVKRGNRTLVKCLVCGDIFDSSQEICPVCGVGKEHFVPYEEESVSFKRNTKEVYIILGNGAAGISAAEAIRERNETCSIVLVSNEAVCSYNRPMLTKSLSTLLSANEIAIHKEDWYKQNNIINMLGVNVDKLISEEKVVILNDGTKLKYDKCIYALGSECFIPPFVGYDQAEVIAIRRIADVEKIRAFIPKVNNTVVIGGGVLGLEAAWEMSKSSKVTVLEIADKLMGRQLDDAAGELLGTIIKEIDIDFRVNAKITEITGEGSVSGVKLEDGEFHPAELVIVSCGIRSNSEVAQGAGIAVERGVVVNNKMETSVADIYACGDCAQYDGINYGIWPQALEMGKVAGANAAGDSLTYETVTAALTFEGMNTSLFAAGDNGTNPNVQYKSVEFKDQAKKTYEKYYFCEECLTGVILIGDISKLVQMTDAIKEKRSFKKMF